ncbi:hypothetical protein LBR03_00990 [Levilactobacillus brevis]|nr:hypothetical protein LBR03_00990 [Levilactobacillus brevis]
MWLIVVIGARIPKLTTISISYKETKNLIRKPQKEYNLCLKCKQPFSIKKYEVFINECAKFNYH